MVAMWKTRHGIFVAVHPRPVNRSRLPLRCRRNAPKISAAPMIRQYNDHAANERTYLAWLRTGIAIIAFGFVLERFDIFLHTIAHSLDVIPAQGFHGGREAGIALVVVGLFTIAVAMQRFAATERQISSESTESYSPRSALWLGALMLALGIFILIYISRLLLASNP